MLHLLWTAIIGLIVGALAKLIIPRQGARRNLYHHAHRHRGRLSGTWIGRAIGHYQPDQSAGFLMSLVGALILLGIYHLIKRSQTA